MKHDNRITRPGAGGKEGTHLGQCTWGGQVDVCALEAMVSGKLLRPDILVRKRRVKRRTCIYQQNPLRPHFKLDPPFFLVITRAVQQYTYRDSGGLWLSGLGRTEHFECDFAVLAHYYFPCLGESL